MSDPVRDAIVATLSAITDIGKVHAYERYSARNSELSVQYVYNGQLRGWFVRRVGLVETSPALGRYFETVRWRIRGYMALDDAIESELVFDGLIDAIVAAFRADDTLGGTVATLIGDDQAGARLEDSGPVLFAGVLCHAARIGLVSRRYF